MQVAALARNQTGHSSGRGFHAYDDAPRLRVDLPHLAVLGKRICEGAGPSGGLALDDTISVAEMTAYALEPSTFENPISYVRCSYESLKGFAPLFHSAPIGRSVRVQPAIGRDAINDDRVIAKNAPEKLDVLGVESVDVSFDQGLDSLWGLSHGHLQTVSRVVWRGEPNDHSYPAGLKGIADGHGASIPVQRPPSLHLPERLTIHHAKLARFETL